jgi:hypothetical protein
MHKLRLASSDPATAEVNWVYAPTVDTYCDQPELPEESRSDANS